MASTRKGQIVAVPSPAAWWKHLRQHKRTFWKNERKAAKRDALTRVALETDQQDR